MTWLVTLTARQANTGEIREHMVRVPGDTAHDLLHGPDYKWKHLEKMLERGSLVRVAIDYCPSNGPGRV